MDDAQFKSALLDVVDKVNTKTKTKSLVHGTQKSFSDVSIYVPTGITLLDYILGKGYGYPSGRVTELFGLPGAGKTTLVTHMMIGFQKYPGISILLDKESKWDKDRAIVMGHNPDRHLQMQVHTLEECFNIIMETVDRIRIIGSKFPKSMPIGIFVDSLDSLQTEAEYLGGEDKRDKSTYKYKGGMVEFPRKLRAICRRLTYYLPENNCSLIFVSHLTANIKSTKGGKKTGSGSAVKFFSTKRLQVEYLFEGGKVNYPKPNSGIIVTCKTVKDQLDPPWREIYLPLMYKTGIDNNYAMLNFLIDNSVYVNVSGAYIEIPELGLKFYKKDLHNVMENNPEVIDVLEGYTELVWHDING